MKNFSFTFLESFKKWPGVKMCYCWIICLGGKGVYWYLVAGLPATWKFLESPGKPWN